MEKFLEALIGSTDYANVLAGLIWAIVGAILMYGYEKIQVTFQNSGLTLLRVFAVMRFYSYITEQIGLDLGMVSTSLAGFISGLIGVSILGKFYEYLKNLLND